METKRCQKCGCIYEATEIRCPTCGKMYRKKHSKMYHKKHSKLWIIPALAMVSVLVAGITGVEEMMPLPFLLIIIWFGILFYRKVLKNNDAPLVHHCEQDQTPVAVRLLCYEKNTTKKKGKLSIAARGLIGGIIGGRSGFAIGVATAILQPTTKRSATFLIEYANGHREAETVDVESERFTQLYNLTEQEF